MLLTVSKRVEFSASRRLFASALSAKENLRLYGEESGARYGTGRNYMAYFVFAGQLDPTTGMLINISEIKERAGSIISDHYDHRYLNEDNKAFADQVPTTKAIAHQLLEEVIPFFRDTPAKLVAVHLRETPNQSATAYSNGVIEGHQWFEFSAARKTVSPNLNDAENARLFGASVFEHGHNYRTRLTIPSGSIVAQSDLDELIASLRGELDHKNLNRDVAPLQDKPITTESLARHILQRAAEKIPLARVRVHEREDFFAEAWSDGGMFLGLRAAFSAAHRLHVRSFSDARNAELFGKCNNMRGHGHGYVSETTIGGEYDERSGALFGFEEMRNAINTALAPWRDKHLDLETNEFREQPSTGENIVRALWARLDGALHHRIIRLRLWETPNNRFTLRRWSGAL